MPRTGHTHDIPSKIRVIPQAPPENFLRYDAARQLVRAEQKRKSDELQQNVRVPDQRFRGEYEECAETVHGAQRRAEGTALRKVAFAP